MEMTIEISHNEIVSRKPYKLGLSTREVVRDYILKEIIGERLRGLTVTKTTIYENLALMNFRIRIWYVPTIWATRKKYRQRSRVLWRGNGK